MYKYFIFVLISFYSHVFSVICVVFESVILLVIYKIYVQLQIQFVHISVCTFTDIWSTVTDNCSG